MCVCVCVCWGGGSQIEPEGLISYCCLHHAALPATAASVLLACVQRVSIKKKKLKSQNSLNTVFTTATVKQAYFSAEYGHIVSPTRTCCQGGMSRWPKVLKSRNEEF